MMLFCRRQPSKRTNSFPFDNVRSDEGSAVAPGSTPMLNFRLNIPRMENCLYTIQNWETVTFGPSGTDVGISTNVEGTYPSGRRCD